MKGMFKVKNSSVETISKLYAKLEEALVDEPNVPMKFSKAFINNSSAINDVLMQMIGKRNELLDKYCKKNEDGSIATEKDGETEKVVFKKGKKNEDKFKADMADYLDKDSVLRIVPLVTVAGSSTQNYAHKTNYMMIAIDNLVSQSEID
jgi:hypothetical protein